MTNQTPTHAELLVRLTSAINDMARAGTETLDGEIAVYQDLLVGALQQMTAPQLSELLHKCLLPMVHDEDYLDASTWTAEQVEQTELEFEELAVEFVQAFNRAQNAESSKGFEIECNGMSVTCFGEWKWDSSALLVGTYADGTEMEDIWAGDGWPDDKPDPTTWGRGG